MREILQSFSGRIRVLNKSTHVATPKVRRYDIVRISYYFHINYTTYAQRITTGGNSKVTMYYQPRRRTVNITIVSVYRVISRSKDTSCHVVFFDFW